MSVAKGGKGVCKMLTMADKGGRGVRQMMTLADKGAGVLAANDNTDKMTKKSLTYWFFLN